MLIHYFNIACFRKIDSEKVALLVDMFYLPFEHGQRGVNLLEEFQWLHENAQIIRSESEANEKEANEWLRRFDAFTGSVNQLTSLYRYLNQRYGTNLTQFSD